MKAVEGTLFANGVLSTGNLKVLSGDEKKFEDTINKLAEEYYADPEASELTRVYKDQLDKALAASGKDVSLKKMACGLSVCAALFSGKDMSQIDFTGTMMNSAQAGGAKLYSSTVTVVPPSRAGDPSAYRVFFATDPTANVIVEKKIGRVRQSTPVSHVGYGQKRFGRAPIPKTASGGASRLTAY